jgi:hypothetical protein
MNYDIGDSALDERWQRSKTAAAIAGEERGAAGESNGHVRVPWIRAGGGVQKKRYCKP